MNLNPNELSQILKDRLSGFLPGFDAQKKMAPYPKSSGSPDYREQTGGELRKNAVLVLLLQEENRLKTLLTIRSDKMPTHKGQISFPGGGIEPDETPEQAALREAYEETGVNPYHVEICGRLSELHVAVSGNLIIPVVGVANTELYPVPDYNEVTEILTPDIGSLIGPENRNVQTRNLRGVDYSVPFWDIHDTPLWGATAMIMSEFTEVLKSCRI